MKSQNQVFTYIYSIVIYLNLQFSNLSEQLPLKTKDDLIYHPQTGYYFGITLLSKSKSATILEKE